jgi:hypothetical protein
MNLALDQNAGAEVKVNPIERPNLHDLETKQAPKTM